MMQSIRRAVSALLAGAALASAAASAAPHIPSDGAEVVEHLPSRNDPVQKEFQRLRAALLVQPGNVALAAELAQRYITVARTDGDPRYLGYAQATLAPWWKMPEPPLPIKVLRATILQSTHQFPAALTDLNGVLMQDHNNAQAWLTRATVLQVQGQYAMAKNSCEHLYALAPELIVTTCLSGIGSVDGEAAKSYTQMAAALQNAPNANPGVKIWVLTLMAETSARRGDLGSAERNFKQAMSLAPPDSYLLGAYSDFLLDQNRPAEVALLLKDKRRIDALLLRYAQALQMQHDAATEAQIEALAERFDAATMRADTVHQREHSRFELHLRHHPVEALRIAELDWQVQKEPADVRVYLEAAAAANDRKAALPVLIWLKENHLEYTALTPLIAKLGGGA